MNSVEFNWARLQHLNGPQVHEMLGARESVFVLEQHCIYQDADEHDAYSWHLLGRVQGQLACYARLVDPGHRFMEPSIGRVLTMADFRAKGLGRRLMQEAIALCKQKYPGQNIRISAQAHLHDFYHSLGFERQGDEYDEEGIPHINMLLTVACI